jgi:hypothetical protein
MHVVFLGDQPYVDLALDLLGQRPNAPPLYPVAGMIEALLARIEA